MIFKLKLELPCFNGLLRNFSIGLMKWKDYLIIQKYLMKTKKNWRPIN